jgi:FMN phosphatase YigB (HAD superfamily)
LRGHSFDTAASFTSREGSGRAVVFDVGRVLVHWHPEATLAGLAEISRAGQIELQQLLVRVSDELGTGALSAGEFHRLLVDQAGTDEDWEVFYAAFCRGVCRDDGALRFASQLAQRGVPLGIISNTNDIHVRWLRANLPELPQFRAVIWSSDVGLLKPDRAIYDLAAREMAVPPAEMMFVDDLAENVAGATAAGLAGFIHRAWDETGQAIEAWLQG